MFNIKISERGRWYDLKFGHPDHDHEHNDDDDHEHDHHEHDKHHNDKHELNSWMAS